MFKPLLFCAYLLTKKPEKILSENAPFSSRSTYPKHLQKIPNNRKNSFLYENNCPYDIVLNMHVY